MWIDTAELVKLIEKLDEAQAALREYLADDTDDEEHLTALSGKLGEMRGMVYRDIASADSPAEIKAGKGKEYKL